MNLNKSDVVRNAARGRWLEVITTLVPDFKDAANNVGHHVPCPVYGGTDGFRFFEDANETGGGVSNQHGVMPNGFEVLMWALQEQFGYVLNEVAEVLDLKDGWAKKAHSVVRVNNGDNYERKIDPKTLEKNRYKLREAWKNAFPLNHPKSELARKYLATRSLDIGKLDLDEMSKAMRFNPSMELWHTIKREGQKPQFKLVGRFPCIVSLVSYSDGKPATIHRTYLDHDGRKLSVTCEGEKVNTKKLMGRCDQKRLSGGGIHLGQPRNATIDVAEGIETALSVSVAKGVPVWPLVSAEMLAKFEPPEGVYYINVWADHDTPKPKPNGEMVAAGIDAAHRLVEAMDAKGIVVNVLCPYMDIPSNAKGVDWNDVLALKGVDAFPSTSHLTLQPARAMAC